MIPGGEKSMTRLAILSWYRRQTDVKRTYSAFESKLNSTIVSYRIVFRRGTVGHDDGGTEGPEREARSREAPERREGWVWGGTPKPLPSMGVLGRSW